jgi:hypothetical protein
VLFGCIIPLFCKVVVVALDSCQCFERHENDDRDPVATILSAGPEALDQIQPFHMKYTFQGKSRSSRPPQTILEALSPIFGEP